ncbi:MAG TPA: 2OG-Fe(II) oxygenase [Acidisoma sp.]|uniref:2OG-Fe(II) oxygenase family protein n=1 Tax=Acidisoma sp. TaxID=1872115 RepID=UPI002D02A2DA|nr:2OG-Fe(II) oxygenase [Acidisoma sp.]HTI03646.1 2OG-Fe(II) oxygenase [Acidisoma sp.]
MALLDLAAFRAAPLVTEPFKHIVLSNFLLAESVQAVAQSFPVIDVPGLLPVEATRRGPLFDALVAELTGPEMTRTVAEKFGLDLEGHPTMVTVRGRCQERDGRIHTDSVTKRITLLLYFNENWEGEGGRLRLLRSQTDMEDVIAEVPPALGTLVMFQRSYNSYHGHESFVGPRRAVMVNWMVNSFAAHRELMRHRISARAKRILRYA